MPTVVLLAKLLGLYLIVSGIFVVTQQKTLGLVLKDMFAHKAITLFIGFVFLLGGGVLALHTDPRASGLALFIDVMAWCIVLKGILYIFAPEWIYGVVKGISRPTFSTMGGLIVVIGIFLFFFIS